MPRSCKCGGALEPHRSLCAKCRDKAKSDALQAARGQSSQVITVKLGGTAPPAIGVAMSGTHQANNTVPCVVCGSPMSESFQANACHVQGHPVCRRCAMHFGRGTLSMLIQGVRERGHPMYCECPTCKASAAKARTIREQQERGPALIPCPECGGPLHSNGGCTVCSYTGGAPMHLAAYGSHQHVVATGYSPGFAAGGIVGGSIGVGPSHIGHGVTRGHGSSMPPSGGRRVPTEPVNLENPDPDRAPDLIEPVLAWRGWNLTADGHLVAAAQDGVWDRGPNRAHCTTGSHTDIPAVGCSCGYYGWHRPQQIQHGEIWGGLKCWGEVIVHDVGIRAEYAEIVVLLEIPGHEGEIDPEKLARAVERYGVPLVQSFEEAEEIAQKTGILVPDSLKPGDPKPAEAFGSMIASRLQPPPGISAQQAMANMSAAVAAVGKSANQSAGTLAKAFSSIEPPKPSPRASIWMRAGMHVGLLASWIAVVAAYGEPLFAGSGLLVGAGIGLLAWCSEWPNRIWRGVHRFLDSDRFSAFVAIFFLSIGEGLLEIARAVFPKKRR